MTREFRITNAQHGAAFTVRVIAGADTIEIAGIQDDGSLQIHLTETPAEGRANAQLIDFLADLLEVDSSQIAIVAGENSPNKIISVDGVSPAQIEQRLARGR
mgnify:CR=1 FL=1